MEGPGHELFLAIFYFFFFFKAPETSHLPFGMLRDWNSRGEFSVGEIILLYWVITTGLLLCLGTLQINRKGSKGLRSLPGTALEEAGACSDCR